MPPNAHKGHTTGTQLILRNNSFRSCNKFHTLQKECWPFIKAERGQRIQRPTSTSARNINVKFATIKLILRSI